MSLSKEELQRVKELFPSYVYSDFTAVQGGFDANNVFNAFKNELDAKAKAVIKDELYDERQKGVQIKREAETLQAKYLEQLNEGLKTHNERIEDLNLILMREQKKWFKAMQTQIQKLGEVDVSQIKTDVMLADKPRDLMQVFKEYLATGDDSEAIFSLIYRNGHIFLNRLNEMTDDHAIKTEFKKLIQTVKEKGQTEEQRYAKTMMNIINKKSATGKNGERLITKYVEEMINNPKRALGQE